MILAARRPCFEVDAKPTSERRFELVGDRAAAVAAVVSGVAEFVRARGICMKVTTNPAEVPPLSLDAGFKYSKGTTGELPGFLEMMERGTPAIISLALIGGAVVGYGIAQRNKRHGAIAVIDVARHSRRAAGLRADILIEEALFPVGVGHAVVAALIHHSDGPFRTNSTNSQSRYIFKSLGFSVASNARGNPCLLSCP
jgi:hypothetical protein